MVAARARDRYNGVLHNIKIVLSCHGAEYRGTCALREDKHSSEAWCASIGRSTHLRSAVEILKTDGSEFGLKVERLWWRRSTADEGERVDCVKT